MPLTLLSCPSVCVPTAAVSQQKIVPFSAISAPFGLRMQLQRRYGTLVNRVVWREGYTIHSVGLGESVAGGKRAEVPGVRFTEGLQSAR